MKYTFSFVLAVLAVFIGAAFMFTGQNKVNPREFFVGTYTRGESEGIYSYRLLANGNLEKVGLAAKSVNPSYLALTHDGKYLLAVNELRDSLGLGGAVISYRLENDHLSQVSKKPTDGASPCFVNVNARGYVLVANYSSGNVALLKLGNDGELDGPLDNLQHEGRGFHERQKGPHAHSAYFESAGDGVVTVDLGTNELWFSTLDAADNKLEPRTPAKLAMADGSGPRHLALHPNKKWAYVMNELSSTVTLVTVSEKGAYKISDTYSSLPSNFAGSSNAADIHISPDGNFLYASNRGDNSIAIFRINKKSGQLMLVGHESVKGDWPRNFTLSPDGKYLLVANERSNNIVSFLRNKKDGTLTFVSEIDAPSPVCLLFK